MRNTVLSDAAQKVLDTKTPAMWTVSAHFFSAAQGSAFSFYPLFLETVSFVRNYADKYTDEIDLTTTISAHDYALLQDQGEDLRCVMTFTYCDQYGKQIFTPDPIQTQYCVFINDPKDIRKAFPDIQHYTEPNVPISVRLVEEVVYKQRKTKINAIYQTVTVTHAIYALTEALGIEKIHMVPSDNTQVYDHVVVGSFQGIDSVYGYLQNAHGVYTKGINAYVTGGVLYVYPAFETNPTYDKSVVFYQADTGQYAGMPSYHRKEGETVSVVITSQSDSFDLTISGSENIGTGFIFNRASRYNSGFTEIDPNTGAKFAEETSLAVTIPGARGSQKDSSNLFHIHATDNPFPAMSELMSHQASLATVNWLNADPFLLDPCTAVSYYYDEDETMVKKTGMIERASYLMSNVRRVGNYDVFACVGNLILRLSPNESKVL